MRAEYIRIITMGSILMFSGCSVAKFAGKSAVTVGKVAGKTVVTTGKIAGKTLVTTGKVAGKAAKTVVQIPGGKRVVKLIKKGNSLYVDTFLNRKVKSRFLLDTGCSDTQISDTIARQLGIWHNTGEKILVNIAGGHVVSGRAVNIKEMRVGRVRVKNVRAIILDDEVSRGDSGLLGMAFLNHFVFRIDAEKGELVLQRRKE